MQLRKGRHKRQHLTLISKRCQVRCNLWLGPVLNDKMPQNRKLVSAKRKRSLFEIDEEDEEDDDEDLKLSETISERKRCELDGDKEPVVSETKGCHTAADVGQSQLPSQPNSVNDGSAVPKSACKKFVLLSAAVSARVEKVVLEDRSE